MTRTKSWLTGGMAVVLAIAVAKLLLHLATASRYGYFGDELYFMACGEHLDWGYVDQPPLVAAVAWLVRHTLGTSLLAMRLPSALAGAALVLLTGLLARELGGGRFAMGLCGLASALAFVYVVMHYLFTMNAFEPLFWTGCAYVLVRIVKTGHQRLWLWFGLLAGVGLQTKHSMAVFAFALVVGVPAARSGEALDLARRGARLPRLPAQRDLERPARLALLRADAEHPGERARRRSRARRLRAASGSQHEPGQPAGLARRPRLAPRLGAGPPLPAARLGVPRDARDLRGHEGQGLLPGPRLRHPLRRGRRRHRGLHGRRLATVAAAGPRCAAGPDAALPAPQPADPGSGPADRVAGTSRLHAAHQREGPRASGPAAPRRLAVRLGRDGGSGGRRVPRHAAGGAGAGRDHRQQLWRLRRDRPARPGVRPADEGPRHPPELLALGARRSVEGRLHRPRRPARQAGQVVRRRQVAAELSHPWTAVWENGPVLVCRKPRLPLLEMWPKVKNWD